jgi:hypothetical protein
MRAASVTSHGNKFAPLQKASLHNPIFGKECEEVTLPQDEVTLPQDEVTLPQAALTIRHSIYDGHAMSSSHNTYDAV